MVSEVVRHQGRAFHIEGTVAPGYEPVLEAFKRNFRQGREIGAACAAYRGERCLVDLWGGYRGRQLDQPWQRDTAVLLMSTTKGLAAMAMALAHSRGWLDLDAPVARYWPEFAQAGKARITVRQMLAYQAGLCLLDTPLTLELLGDRQALAAVLARQAPAWVPGTRHAYHIVTLGLYQDALLQRVDPRGRTLGTILREEIAGKLGLELHIGLPDDVPDSRRAGIRTGRDLRAAFGMPPALLLAMFNRRSLPMRIAATSPVRDLQELDSQPWLRVEMPAVNGVASPRDVARAYAEFASGGQRLGLRAETLRELAAPAVPPSATARDGFYCFDSAYAMGYWKPFPRWRFGTSRSAYGTPGAGGSQGFADPDLGLGFAYAPNRLALGVFDDPRAAALRQALYGCLRRGG